MSRYFYTLTDTTTNRPIHNGLAGGDFSTRAEAITWIQSNAPGYTGGSTDILTIEVSTLEAGYRGFLDGIGATTDSAATVGSTGSINAKLRLLTSLIDTINTNINSINTNEASFSVFTQGRLTAAIDTEIEIKVGASRLTGRRGYYVKNNGAGVVYIGATGVTTNPTTSIGRPVAVNEFIFEPYGNVARFAISASALDITVEEVK